MWGESARPARRDGPSAAVSVDGESDVTITDVASVVLPHASDDEEQAAFRRRSARFDEAERLFNSLMRSLDEHKAALVRVAETGVAVAEKLNDFFSAKDAHRELASSFLNAQNATRSEWAGFERRYDREVLSHIRNRVDEIPRVRAGIKQRANALAEMKKLQRKTASERKIDGPFAKVKQRRLKELKDVSAMYAMHHSEVMRKFSNIERNFGNFVSPALVSLVSLLAEATQSSVKSLEDVQKLVAAVPPMTRELSPAPMLDNRCHHGTPCDVGETWDADFDDPMLSPTSSPPAPSGATLSLPGDSSSTAAHQRSRSEPVAAGLGVHVVPPERRRLAHSTDTASLPEMLSPRNSRQTQENGYGPSDSTAAGHVVGTSGSTSSGERVVDVDGSLTGGGGGSEMSGRVRDRGKPEARDRRHRRDGMGSNDTVPSDNGGSVRSGVQMRLYVLYDFMPREMNEIELRKGDVVEVTEKTDSGWWYGRCRRRAGFFPRNYTRELTDQEEADYVSSRHRRQRRQGHRRRDSRESRRSGKSASASAAAAAASAAGASHALAQP